MKIEINDRGETVIQGDILVFVDGEVKGCVVALDTKEGWVEQILYLNKDGKPIPFVGENCLIPTTRALPKSTAMGVVKTERSRLHGKIEIKDPPALPSAPTVSPA